MFATGTTCAVLPGIMALALHWPTGLWRPGRHEEPHPRSHWLQGKQDSRGCLGTAGHAGLPGTAAFQRALRAAVHRSKGHGPALQSRSVTPAAALGFCCHHAKRTHRAAPLGTGTQPAHTPGTHQVGVAGAAFDENTRKTLVVQDRNKLKNTWKFLGGLSEPGEDVGNTALEKVLKSRV